MVDVSTDAAIKTQKSTLASVPDIIVGTPTRVVAHLAANVSRDRDREGKRERDWGEGN